MEIRSYRDSDLDAVARLWLESWISTGVALERPVTVAELRERFPEEIAAGWTVFVATIDGEIAGFLSLSRSTLEQLFIAPDYQNRGIGKTLLDFVKARVPDGFDLITAVESRAPQFYEREGLVRREESRHPVHGHRIVRYEWAPRCQRESPPL
ncbi:MAG TPA: GNAT family N-acetyltransferase [Rhizomicrobium sp.]|nr:GNAT family N-acetyltransferase [Rhizomicrobium sp.]